MMPVAGVAATRRADLEEARIALHPGTTVLPCGDCGADCALAPSSRALVDAGESLYCVACGLAAYPDVVFILPPGAADELAVIDRLNRPGEGSA